MSTPAAAPPRERILEAARDLFYREGIRAVGVDTIVARSGVAKMSLYRYFPSKDHLVVAFLEDSNRRYWEWWDTVMLRHPGDARRQLGDLFEALARRVAQPSYRGCPFLNTASEFREPTAAGREIVVANKREVRRRLRALAAAASARDPDALAAQLHLLMDGAYASAQALHDEAPVDHLCAAAEALISAQLDQ